MTVTTPQIISTAASAALFIVMWKVLGTFLLKPYLALLEQREARTSGDERRAQEIAARCEEVRRQIDDELKNTRLEGLEMRDQVVNAAREKAKARLESATESARSDLDNARNEIERMQLQAKKEVESEASQIAQAMLSRILSSRGEQTIH